MQFFNSRKQLFSPKIIGQRFVKNAIYLSSSFSLKTTPVGFFSFGSRRTYGFNLRNIQKRKKLIRFCSKKGTLNSWSLKHSYLLGMVAQNNLLQWPVKRKARRRGRPRQNSRAIYRTWSALVGPLGCQCIKIRKNKRLNCLKIIFLTCGNCKTILLHRGEQPWPSFLSITVSWHQISRVERQYPLLNSQVLLHYQSHKADVNSKQTCKLNLNYRNCWQLSFSTYRSRPPLKCLSKFENTKAFVEWNPYLAFASTNKVEQVTFQSLKTICIRHQDFLTWNHSVATEWISSH